MSVQARTPNDDAPDTCAGCRGTKKTPIATVVAIYHEDLGVTLALCQECGRDVANAIGFMCIRDGGWSKLEPRKSKTRRGR